MTSPRTAPVAVRTTSGFIVSERALDLVFADAFLIKGIFPEKGSMAGGYPFTLYGDFEYIKLHGVQQLFWGEEDITSQVTGVSNHTITGVVPPSDTQGRRYPKIVSNLLTFKNATVHFTYLPRPTVESCWPYSGQTSSETPLTIKGSHFDSEVTCLFGEPSQATFAIAPIFANTTHVVCPMHEHHETGVTPIWLGLWDNTTYVDSNCTYFYYRDVVIDYLGPDHLSIYAHDNGVVVEVGGFNFREDDKANNSLQARIDGQVLPDQVEFVSDTLVRARARNMPTEGTFPLYVSNNHGISWQRSSSFIALKYHLPPQVNFVDVDKIQVPTTAADSDITPVDVAFSGEFFPAPSSDPADTTTFHCVWGSNDTLPFFQTVWPAERVSTQLVRCLGVPVYDSSVLPDPTYVDVQLSYNLQEYWGMQRILYYPRVHIEKITQHVFSQS